MQLDNYLGCGLVAIHHPPRPLHENHTHAKNNKKFTNVCWLQADTTVSDFDKASFKAIQLVCYVYVQRGILSGLQNYKNVLEANGTYIV